MTSPSSEMYHLVLYDVLFLGRVLFDILVLAVVLVLAVILVLGDVSGVLVVLHGVRVVGDVLSSAASSPRTYQQAIHSNTAF